MSPLADLTWKNFGVAKFLIRVSLFYTKANNTKGITDLLIRTPIKINSIEALMQLEHNQCPMVIWGGTMESVKNSDCAGIICRLIFLF